MMKKVPVVFFSLLIQLLLFQSASAQSNRVELIGAGSLEGTEYMGQPVRKLEANVRFKHSGYLISCDLAYQYILRNDLEAFGNARIQKGESQNITGDYMIYQGDIKQARITGKKVTLVNNTLTLVTTALDYDMTRDVVTYHNKGTMTDKESNLVSDEGVFYKDQNLFIFTKNVVFSDSKYTIFTDTLEYNTVLRQVKFRGPSRIIGPDGVINTVEGEYDTERKITKFNGRTRIVYSGYIVFADKLDFDQQTKLGIAHGNVEVMSPKDSVTVFGDHARFWGEKNIVKIYQNTLMQSVSSKDTLYLTADTLVAINDTLHKNKKILAFHKVKIFNKEFQCIADSLINDAYDSTLTFYKDPVLWNAKNQMRGDTVRIFTKKSKLSKIQFRTKAFVISTDTLGNYNQAKGKNITAYFESNKIKNILVKDNAETIFFVLQGDTAVVGINQAKSDSINIRFKSQRIKILAFYKKPTASMIPMHEVKDEHKRIRGFKLRTPERPNRAMVLGKHYNKKPNPNKK